MHIIVYQTIKVKYLRSYRRKLYILHIHVIVELQNLKYLMQ